VTRGLSAEWLLVVDDVGHTALRWTLLPRLPESETRILDNATPPPRHAHRLAGPCLLKPQSVTYAPGLICYPCIRIAPFRPAPAG
jgi:hypothetical protein